MNLKSLFKKPVDRPIEGVIKADDEASLRSEIEEYVLTNEVEKRLETFLDAYNNYEGANGVWISGFFGSGKSHLLKMLALLLENRLIDGSPVIDLMLPKCGDNEILRGDLKRAVAIPSRSILFNIDQKADVISKTQIDALLSVFVKVFDEMCGYYGKHGHIAQFERDLDTRGLFTDFQSAYHGLTGRHWRQGREQALLESRNIANAYAQVTGEDTQLALGILDKYRNQYRVSIEDFAEQINAYIERQEPNFRLNFFVDEVGQYIADNIKLMTNLQTIAESLATRCRGRAWVIVTAQEDMNSVVGEMTRQQGNDFSKIQARFANRMKLTSADVAEVIQKRLLLKNDQGIAQLSDVYHAEANNFKTLFDFADGSVAYKNFQDRDHFIHGYPFIPYQFGLFQSAIQNLSAHNAFEGKHSSVGERSMLGVFQQVAIHIGDHEIGELATFDLMFEGIRTALKTHIQRAVLQAENELDNPLAIRLLKALLLVKYVREFKATTRNLCILMLDGFSRDLPQLRKQVEEALCLLEQQTYIQRNGELYEYLTDEEKDVEQEIKNTDVDIADVMGELEKIVFDGVLKDRKIRYDGNGQDYAYSRKLDDRLYGRESELAIHIISPFHEHADKDELHRTDTVYRDELRVLMPADERLIRELLTYKRTEKYIRQNMGLTQQDSIKRILTDKGFQNRERLNDIQQRVQALLGKARLFVAGQEKETSSEDGKTRILTGFHELIAHVYPNLRMLRGIAYTENEIGKYLTQAKGGIFAGDDKQLAESEQEMLAFIQSNIRGGVRTTLKSLLEKFERKPYGWYYAANLCLLASLYGRGKIELRADGNLLEEDEIERALRNTHGHGNVVLDPQVEFTASQVRGLKSFFEDFFDTPPKSTEPKTLGKETGDAMDLLHEYLQGLVSQSDRYGFLQALTPALDRLKEMKGKPYGWFLSELQRDSDALLDLKESVIDPIRKFMTGPHKSIFDQALQFVTANEPNFPYLDGDEAKLLKLSLRDPECFKGQRMQAMRTALDSLRTQIEALLTEVKQAARDRLANLKERLTGMTDFSRLTPDDQAGILAEFDQRHSELDSQTLIAVIRESLRRFDEMHYPALVAKISTAGIATPETGYEPDKPTPMPPISLRSLTVHYPKVLITQENEVEEYLGALRSALLNEIRSGKKIQTY
jgi:hypothetical protein